MPVGTDAHPVDITIERKTANELELVLTAQEVPDIVVMDDPVLLRIRVLHEHRDGDADLRAGVEDLATLPAPVRGILVALEVENIDAVELLGQAFPEPARR